MEGNQQLKIRTLLSELVLGQSSLVEMLQVLDMVDTHVKAVRQALVQAFGVENDNGQTD